MLISLSNYQFLMDIQSVILIFLYQILLGIDDSARSDETWEWDGSSWALVCGGDTGCTGPTGRFQHAMVYDSISEQVVLYGGNLDSKNINLKEEDIIVHSFMTIRKYL